MSNSSCSVLLDKSFTIPLFNNSLEAFLAALYFKYKACLYSFFKLGLNSFALLN